MSEVIQCPQCDKRYSLPEQVPATFTCRQCNTLMDLSDFGGGAEPVPPAEPPPAAPPASRRTRGRGRRGRRGGRGGGGGSQGAVPTPHPTPRRGGRRGRVEHQYDEDHPQHHHYRHKKDNTALIIGSVAALVVAIVLIIVVKVNKEDDPQPPPDSGKKTARGNTQPVKKGSEPIAGAPTPADGTAPAGAGTSPAGAAPAGGTAPAAGTAPSAGASNKPSRRGRYKGMSKVKLEVFEWPEDVDAETRAKAEEGIKALYSGGADWSDAQDWFVAQGRPICGRLISEFKNIQDSPGFADMGGRSLVGAVDQLLRKIDGWMERNRKELNPVRASSHPNFVLRTCQRWTWWWKYDEWKANPQKPWDPFEDESDETESGIKEPEKKKKGGGFGKRAGGG